MGDGFTHQARAQIESEYYESVTVPLVEKTLVGKKPEELTPVQNEQMYDYLRWKETEEIRKAISEIESKYYSIRREHFDAFLAQGLFYHKNGKVFRKECVIGNRVYDKGVF